MAPRGATGRGEARVVTKMQQGFDPPARAFPTGICEIGSWPQTNFLVTFLLGGRTSACAECRHWSGRGARWSSCAILLSLVEQGSRRDHESRDKRGQAGKQQKVLQDSGHGSLPSPYAGHRT